MQEVVDTRLLLEFGRHMDEHHIVEARARTPELESVEGLRVSWIHDEALSLPLNAEGRYQRLFGPLEENLAFVAEDPNGTPGQRRAAQAGDDIEAAKISGSIHGTECAKSYAFYGSKAQPIVRSIVWALGLEDAIVYSRPRQHFAARHNRLFGAEISREGPLTLDRFFKAAPQLVDIDFLASLDPEPPINEYVAIGAVSAKEADELDLPDFEPFTRIPIIWAERLGFCASVIYAGPWGRERYARTKYVGELLVKRNAGPNHYFEVLEEDVLARARQRQASSLISVRTAHRPIPQPAAA
jgi:hypothetical protein